MSLPYFSHPGGSLSKDLIKAYQDSTGSALDISEIKKSVNDATIGKLITELGRVLIAVAKQLNYNVLNPSGEVIDYRSLYKILTGNDSDISQRNRRKIYDYITYSKNHPLLKPVKKFSGSYLIDDDFKQSVIKKSNLEIIDFYTSKSNPDIQWSGIFREYDIKRSSFDKLKLLAYSAFNTKNSKVAAIIIGLSGSGKTTLLRRLAKECIENPRFNTLWIYDISEFSFATLKESNENYLMILDDWSKTERSPDAKQRFLNNIAELTNIRLIIADYVVRDEIAEMLYGDNVLALSSEKNKDVITEIIENVPDWKKKKEEILSLKEQLFNAPLFIVLFVIAKKFSDDSALDFEDFESEFNKIIKSDLKVIYNKHIGISKALYYCSCAFKELRVHIIWEVLLKLAALYDTANKISESLQVFESKNPVVKVLNSYFSLIPIVIPNHSDENLLEFNHNLLVEALAKPVEDEWVFDDDAKIDLLYYLIEIEAYDIAAHLYDELDWEQFFDQKQKIKSVIREKIAVGESFGWHFKMSDSITNLYANFRDKDEYDIKDCFFDIIVFLSAQPESRREHLFLTEIVTKLINAGCCSEFVQKMQELRDDEVALSAFVWDEYIDHRYFLDYECLDMP